MCGSTQLDKTLSGGCHTTHCYMDGYNWTVNGWLWLVIAGLLVAGYSWTVTSWLASIYCSIKLPCMSNLGTEHSEVLTRCAYRYNSCMCYD